jgi:L-ribulose-5-phosphate 3-epimerase
VLERLNTLCDIADAEGCVCYHENEKDIFGDTAARVLQIHEAVGPRLHGVFDPANYIQCGETPVDIWPQIKPHIDYLHIKDALLEDGSVVPAGCGDGGIASLLEDFREPDAGRLLTIEPHLAVFEGLSNLQSHGVKHKYAYPSNDAAFDAACSALKEILKERGYSYE